MPIEIHLILLMVFGGIAAAIASGKGRNPVAWFFGGFFLGLIGVVIVACLSDEKAAQARTQRSSQERRRLREKLRQETMKNEAFRKHTVNRMDEHDRVLGTKTRNTRRLRGNTRRRKRLARGEQDDTGGPSQRSLSTSPVPDQVDSEASGPDWYYEINGETMGPIAEAALADMLRAKQIPFSTLLCQEDQENWKPASQVLAFRKLMDS